MDTTDTTDSTETDEPQLDPDAPMYSESGKISHPASNFLTFYADWTAVSEDGKTAIVTVTPGIECYKLKTGKHDLTVTVNDQEILYESNAIEHQTDKKVTLPFAPKTFEIELEGTKPYLLEITVLLDYGDDDDHGSEIIEELKASITVTFPGGEEIPSEPEDNAERINEQNELLIQ